MVALFLGIDFGTSGARGIVIDQQQQVVAQARCGFEPSDRANPEAWQRSLHRLLAAIAPDTRAHLTRIAINGTSATVILCDRFNQPLAPALMYNDASGRAVLPELQKVAPKESPVLSATSSLAKVMWWRSTLPKSIQRQVSQVAHQADWLASLLHGRSPTSDYHNALKLGYDVEQLTYPHWLLALPVADWVPPVLEPGEAIAPVSKAIASKYDIPSSCQICAGTTDSIAAFLASGAQTPGEAVTSLGSTLVLKMLSTQPINQSSIGVYSHRLGNLWLAGGASNSGGTVLRQFFSDEELIALSQQIDLSEPIPFDYYPLSQPGERFPINDSDYPPQLSPRPQDDVLFLHGLLGAIARIEATGYQTLETLGAPKLKKVRTAGGGAQNEAWRQLRQQQLQVPVHTATQTEAAYGSAQLARIGLAPFQANSSP